jgi:hypothetical protein
MTSSDAFRDRLDSFHAVSAEIAGLHEMADIHEWALRRCRELTASRLALMVLLVGDSQAQSLFVASGNATRRLRPRRQLSDHAGGGVEACSRACVASPEVGEVLHALGRRRCSNDNDAAHQARRRRPRCPARGLGSVLAHA